MHELHRPVRIERIGSSYIVEIAAEASELKALASRMQIAGVLSLDCRFVLRPGPNDTFMAAGHLKARVVQTCVVTLEDFEADLAEHFTVHFVPSGSETDDIDPESDDEIPYEDGTIDLGEAAAEQLALSLDPYPRSAGAEVPAEAEDDAANPFAALKRLQS